MKSVEEWRGDTGGKISEFEDRVTEIIQSDQNRENVDKPSGACGGNKTSNMHITVGARVG